MKYFAYCRKSSEGEERQALSIPAQIDEIKKSFVDTPDAEIVAWFEEKMSAKAPGRPVYAEMIRRIEKGEAEGIAAWHPDRLARNSVDGGWIIHLLDRKTLKNLKFASYSYEQSPEGMFMLQIMFGQSKYYVDNLSVNVKRGIRKRIELGWWSNRAPVGYRNDHETNLIAIDPERFKLVQQAWALLLSGAYSVSQIRDTLNNVWGFRTAIRKKTGGKPIALSTLYKIFKNPFYAGIMNWRNEWRPGKHEKMITLEEFHRARAILGNAAHPKPEKYHFAFTGGLIKCACGLPVTAEQKTKPSGLTYVYYHCTRSSRTERCREAPVRVEVIEQGLKQLLQDIQIPEQCERFIQEKIERSGERLQTETTGMLASAALTLEQVQRQQGSLVDLRVRGMIDDAEFTERRQMLQKEAYRLREAIVQKSDVPTSLELSRSVLLFRKYAADWFSAGNRDDKRLIFQTVASNSVLSGKTLSIQARIPFQPAAKPADCLYLCGIVDELGTPDRADGVRELVESIKYLQKRAERGFPANDEDLEFSLVL